MSLKSRNRFRGVIPLTSNDHSTNYTRSLSKPDLLFQCYYECNQSSSHLNALSALSKFYSEISVKPDFAIQSGRFTLRSKTKNSAGQLETETIEFPKQFHVHSQIMQLYSVELKRFIDGNLDEIMDGKPFLFHCSSEALDSLLKIIYLQKIDEETNEVLHEILSVAHTWKMDEILTVCESHMEDHYEKIESFDILLRWFVAAHKFELRVEKDIFMELFEMVKEEKNNVECRTYKTHYKQLKTQVNEYAKTLSPEDSCDLFMKFLEF